ncbi:hypothetical protein D3C84_484220 [compost metagenome]
MGKQLRARETEQGTDAVQLLGDAGRVIMASTIGINRHQLGQGVHRITESMGAQRERRHVVGHRYLINPARQAGPSAYGY